MPTPPEQTVADAMLRHPTVHAADLTVGAARAMFEDSPKARLLLLTDDGMLVSTVARDDLDAAADPAGPAAGLGSLADRTVAPDVPLATAYDHMTGGLRRLAVVDDSGRLLGLLCLKRNLTGFCTDDGVAALRHTQG